MIYGKHEELWKGYCPSGDGESELQEGMTDLLAVMVGKGCAEPGPLIAYGMDGGRCPLVE